ncbi:hypothetical protein HUU62_02665 [Rhodoferax sp. 4810]|nr:hypothetical protein [Rhodoferax jenense]
MNTFTNPSRLTDEPVDERVALLDEVEFKWLLTGLGLWIDMSRFHLDPSYATHFLKLAEASDSCALHDCAAVLRSQGSSIFQ